MPAVDKGTYIVVLGGSGNEKEIIVREKTIPVADEGVIEMLLNNCWKQSFAAVIRVTWNVIICLRMFNITVFMVDTFQSLDDLGVQVINYLV